MQSVSAAVQLKPRIKLVLIRDPVLNDRRNEIHVNASAGLVRLTGHVVNAGMKTRAGEDTQEVLSDHHAPDKLENDLTVAAGK